MVYRRKKPMMKRRLKKRWAFNASANLGPLGKYSIGFKRGINNAIRNLAEPQHNVVSDVATGVTLKHNSIYTLSVTSLIPQGTNENSRMGDHIHLDALKLKNTFTGAANGNSKAYIRIMLIKSTKQYNLSTWSSGIGLSDIAMQNLTSTAYTGGQFSVSFIPDPKKVTVLYDATHALMSTTTGNNDSKLEHVTIPIKQSFSYFTNSVYGKQNNFYLLALPYLTAGVSGTTDAVNIYTNYDLIFKNIK